VGERPVLLIHSGVGAGSEWSRVIEQIGPALTPDLYGHGDAAIPDEPWSHAGQMAALLINGPTVVCGASYGGMVALQLATLAPERIARLVLCAPAFPDWEWGPEMDALDAAEDAAIEAGDLAAAVEANVRLWAPAGDEEIVRANQRRALDLQLEAKTEPEEMPVDLGRLGMPVTILVGDADLPDFGAIARHIAAEVPHAELHVLPGAGHLLALERPAEVARAL
jgi:pimeloyl-ACP methyl ester carboxylesterase